VGILSCACGLCAKRRADRTGMLTTSHLPFSSQAEHGAGAAARTHTTHTRAAPPRGALAQRAAPRATLHALAGAPLPLPCDSAPTL
jgi:hypothetical protein